MLTRMLGSLTFATRSQKFFKSFKYLVSHSDSGALKEQHMKTAELGLTSWRETRVKHNT